MADTGRAPPGWPRAVPPPGVPGWEDRAVAWLLDIVPGEYRRYDVLRRYPELLARFASDHVSGALTAARSGWRTLRSDFPVGKVETTLPPHAVQAAMEAYEREGARLVALEREVALVREALAGRRWVQRL